MSSNLPPPPSYPVPPPPAPVVAQAQRPPTPSPTSKKERVKALDFVRGLAVLGILLANIHWMGVPAFASTLEGGVYGFGDQLTSTLSLMLVNGKFRGMLAIMFGVGLAMQHERLSRVMYSWMGPYAKRTAFLLLIGFLHAVFIWFGDILFGYALTAFAAMCLVKLRLRWLALISGACWAIVLGFVVLMFVILPSASGDFAGGGLEAFPEPLQNYFSEENETAIFQGGYLGQLGFRAAMFGFNLFNAPILVIGTLPLFLIGIIAYRAGWVSPRSGQGPPLLLVLTMLVVGLALNALAFATPTTAGEPFVQLGMLSTTGLGAVIDFSLSVPLAVAYFFLFFALGKKIAMTLGIWATSVGRMALTAYLMQSVLGMIFFAGWGFGYFNRLDDTGLFYTVLGIWAIVITFCMIWMSRFDIGPVEKLWRQLSLGRKVPWRSPESPQEVRSSGDVS